MMEAVQGERLKHRATYNSLAQKPTQHFLLVDVWMSLGIQSHGLYMYISFFSFCRYSDLLSLLPTEVKGHCYCQQLLTTLQDLSHYMRQVGPQKMSKKRLMQVGGWAVKL